MSATHTRVHTFTTFANPYMVCGVCGEPVPRWHNPDVCGCSASFWNEPCQHRGGGTSLCPSWGPVDGCTCLATLGEIPHPVHPKEVERS